MYTCMTALPLPTLMLSVNLIGIMKHQVLNKKVRTLMKSNVKHTYIPIFKSILKSNSYYYRVL